MDSFLDFDLAEIVATAQEAKDQGDTDLAIYLIEAAYRCLDHHAGREPGSSAISPAMGSFLSAG